MDNNRKINKYGILSELFDGCQLLIAPGDVADKLTILNIKAKHFEDGTPKAKLVHDELARTILLMDRIVDYHPDVCELKLYELIRDLRAINEEQWASEDRVRTEQSWEAAFYARQCNTKRVNKKNEINQLFEYPVEAKDYAGTNNDKIKGTEDNEETQGNEVT